MCDGPYGSDDAFSCNKNWTCDSNNTDPDEGADLAHDNAPNAGQHSTPEQLNDFPDSSAASEWLW
jgi:hypothetical protein